MTPEILNVERVDAVLAARNAAAAEVLAGLIAAAQLDTVGTPRKLPQDEFPDYPPEMVAEVWARALVVGMRAAELKRSPYFYRDKLERLQGELAAAGYAAMARDSRAVLAGPAAYPELHAVDDEEARGH
ncbi:MAG: hypothetical protein HOY79_04515 [Streptomyces sp.]|nr:hypothetical protein [Streptomyces sp.]NUS15469.1 hypothetical protein [Streptomyces sp.]NUS24073.1 hypothetical protein [Streptomyces sp.]